METPLNPSTPIHLSRAAKMLLNGRLQRKGLLSRILAVPLLPSIGEACGVASAQQLSTCGDAVGVLHGFAASYILETSFWLRPSIAYVDLEPFAVDFRRLPSALAVYYYRRRSSVTLQAVIHIYLHKKKQWPRSA